MADEASAALMADLPVQRAPSRSGAAPPRLRTGERRQVSLRPVCLEDLVPAEHRVRLVWQFVESLDLTALYEAIKAVEGQPGHPRPIRASCWRCGCMRRWKGLAVRVRCRGCARCTSVTNGSAASSA